MRDIFRDRVFLRLWCGTFVSGIATWALPFLLGLLLIEDKLSPGALGVSLAARTIGFLAVLPFSGVLADLWSPVKVIRYAGLIAAVATVGFAYTLVVGAPSFTLLLTALFIGVGQGACRPAYQSLIATNIAPEVRKQAHAAITLAQRIVIVVAPAAIAVMSRSVDTTLLVGGLAGLWLIVMWSPNTIRQETGDATLRTAVSTTGPGLIAGWKEAHRHRWFMAGLALLVVVIMLGYSVTGVLLPVVSAEVFGSDWLFTVALIGYAGGAIFGALIIGHWTPPAQGWWALAGLAGYGLVAAALAATLTGIHWAVVVIAYVIAGLGIEFFNVPWFTCIQREVPPTAVARVSSIDFIVSYGLAPVGLALIAPAAQYAGMIPVLLFTAIACVATGAAVMCVPGTRDFHDPKT
ncbi:MAG: MFS transporter [Corynebacterium sp.]|uniref:MFS transporter n=1 Tax=Corynebacterium sp. TaxID=1720 RepID=UPI0026DBAD32|nr:MFS transporter [Corynebacterium sp.]MDO5097898.1 MFS transporter [Corynebacterium sp.]